MSKNRLKLIIIVTLMMVIILTVGVVKSVIGQSDYVYVPDRPGMAANAYAIQLHHADYEASMFLFRYADDAGTTTTLTETNLFRYGAFKRLELRAGFNINHAIYPDKSTITGVRDVNLGVKIPIISNIQYAPDVAVLGTIVLPNSGNKAFTPTLYIPSAALLLQKSFGSALFISNVGILYDASTVDGYYLTNPHSINCGIQGTYAIAFYYFMGKVGVMAETYGYYADKMEPYTAFDCGVTIAVNNSVEVDLSIGAEYDMGFDNSFINVGFGWLIPTKQ